MNWIVENWDSILLIITGIISVASVIAKLTPTHVDDNIIGRIIILMDKLALNNKPTEIK